MLSEPARALAETCFSRLLLSPGPAGPCPLRPGLAATAWRCSRPPPRCDR